LLVLDGGFGRLAVEALTKIGLKASRHGGRLDRSDQLCCSAGKVRQPFLWSLENKTVRAAYWRMRCEMIFVLPLIAAWVPRCSRVWLEWF
jgi:hypothetical protein